MKTDYTKTVYTIENGVIQTYAFADYLYTFWNDETTSPRGVENRDQIASVLLDESGDVVSRSLNDRDQLELLYYEVKWCVMTWQPNGKTRQTSELFDTEDEAEEAILAGMEHDSLTKSYNVPCCYFDLAEAQAALRDQEETED